MLDPLGESLEAFDFELYRSALGGFPVLLAAVLKFPCEVLRSLLRPSKLWLGSLLDTRWFEFAFDYRSLFIFKFY